jgi:hypothetical protein
MSSSATFVEKVQALQPELVGTTDEEKSKIQSLVNEVPALAKDLQVGITKWGKNPRSKLIERIHLQALNTKLTPLVYLNANKPSIADVSLYCELHPEVVSQAREV